MKVTSDRIKARALQLKKEGFKLSGNTVRKTLELNAGARTQLTSGEPTVADDKAPEKRPQEPEKAEAA